MKQKQNDAAFCLNRENVNWLAFLRITTALFALIHFAAIQPDFDNFFSFNAYIQPDILDAAHDNLSPTIIDIHEFCTGYFPSLRYESLLLGFRITYFISLILLCIGLFSRFNAIISLLIQLVLIKSISLYQYGADVFTTILLFYCMLFPTGRVLSVSNMIFKRKDMVKNPVHLLRLLQAHICIVYFVSGIDKAVGFNWWNGEAFWKAITSHNMTGFFDLSFMKNTPFFIAGGWVTIIIEVLYPVFININKTRKLWLILTIGLHLGIALFLGLFLFAAIMIIFNLAAYYVPYLKEKKKTDTAPGAGTVMHLPVPA